MHKGFAAYSLPDSTDITVVKGSFVPFNFATNLQGSAFLLNAWEGKPEMLCGEHSTNDQLVNELFGTLVMQESASDFVETTDFVWKEMIESAKRQMEMGMVQKVVLSRSVKVSVSTELFTAFKRAVAENPQAFVYFVYHSAHGCWMGATPELLLAGKQNHYETMALAGTLTPEQNNWGEKEVKENTVTDNFIRHMIDQCGGTNLLAENRKEIKAGHLRHLQVNYKFNLDKGNEIQLLNSLHPTPAVGGYPREQALRFISELERHQRGLYTGWIGVATPERLSVFVNLRCARLFDNAAILYAGAGINSESDWQIEWRETAEKMEVIGKYLNG